MRRFLFLSIILCTSALTGVATPPPHELIQAGQQKLLSTGATSSFYLYGQRFWVKSIEAQKKSWTFALKRQLVNFLAPKALYKSAIVHGDAILDKEVERLRQFRQAGVRVPSVLAQTPHLLILSDLGPTAEKQIKKAPAQKKLSLLRQAADALQKLHRLGLAHGRPMLKDMTLNDLGQVGFLDLGEAPPPEATLAQNQARDLLLFLFSALPLLETEPQQQYGLIDHVFSQATPAQRLAIEEVKDDLGFINKILTYRIKKGARVGKDTKRLHTLFSGLSQTPAP